MPCVVKRVNKGTWSSEISRWLLHILMPTLHCCAKDLVKCFIFFWDVILNLQTHIFCYLLPAIHMKMSIKNQQSCSLRVWTKDTWFITSMFVWKYLPQPVTKSSKILSKNLIQKTSYHPAPMMAMSSLCLFSFLLSSQEEVLCSESWQKLTHIPAGEARSSKSTKMHLAPQTCFNMIWSNQILFSHSPQASLNREKLTTRDIYL